MEILDHVLYFPGLNQVETFLEEHGCPGIQHIGLHTPDITRAVSMLKRQGVHLINPPDAYYTQVQYSMLAPHRRKRGGGKIQESIDTSSKPF